MAREVISLRRMQYAHYNDYSFVSHPVAYLFIHRFLLTRLGLRLYWATLSIFILSCGFQRIRVSSGSIVSNYGLEDRAIGVRSPAGAKDFSSSLCVQTGSGAHPASCSMGTGGIFPGGKSAAGA
jgi:hypothetical protein